MSESFDVKVELLSSPGELPIRVRAAGGTGAMIGRIGVGAMLAIVGFLIWTGSISLGHALGPAMASNIALAVIALGGLQVLRGLFSRGRSHEFFISADAVEKRTGPGGKWKGGGWKEPLSSYRGVRWRRMNVEQGRKNQVHVVELVHPDPARTVPLFARTSGRANARDTLTLVRDAFAASRSGTGDEAALRAEGLRLARQATGSDVRDVWEELAALLGMPAIDARGDGEQTRDAADLDKSISELAAEDKVATVWDDKPAPSGLEVTKLGPAENPEALEVRILKSVVPPLLRPLFYVFGALFLLMVLTGQGEGSIAGGLLAAVVFLGAPSLFESLEVKNPRTLRITRQEIAYRDPNRTRRRDFAIPLSSIENVHTERRIDVKARNVPERFIGRELVVSTDALEYRLGKGLSDEALEWLRDYLVSAMAHA